MGIVDTLLAIDTSIHANFNDVSATAEQKESIRSISRHIYMLIGKYDIEKSERLLDAMDWWNWNYPR